MVYLMVGYNIREGKIEALKKWLGSEEAKEIFRKIEKQSEFRYLNTYFTIIPSSSEQGDFDAYDWWEFPNFAALDHARAVNAWGPYVEKTYNMTEPRPTKFVLMRTREDVQVIYEPKK